jgi:hypothetical protein
MRAGLVGQWNPLGGQTLSLGEFGEDRLIECPLANTGGLAHNRDGRPSPEMHDIHLLNTNVYKTNSSEAGSVDLR